MKRALTGLLLALAIAPYFVRLGVPDLWDVNETLYAEPPREALETGEWLFPTMNYEPWFVKPPGATWAILPFYAVLGPNECAERLSMALASALTILLTWRIGVRTAGPRAGLLAAVLLATTVKFFMFSRQLAGDVFLTTAWTVALWGYLRWFGSAGRMRMGLWIAAAVLGPATLLKGPIALFLPALALPVHLWFARGRGERERLRPLGPALLALALAAPWFGYAAWRYGADFVWAFFGHHHLERFFTEKLGEGRGPFYYPSVYPGDTLPWFVVLPGALWIGRRVGVLRREPWLSALVWSLVLLGFFTLSTGKREVYLMPTYPTLALVAAAAIDRVVADPALLRLGRRAIVVPLLAAAIAVVGGAVWFAIEVRLLRGTAIGIAGAAAAWAMLLWWRACRSDVQGAVWFTAAMLWLASLWVAGRQDLLEGARPARAFAEHVAAHAAPDDVAIRYDVRLHSLMFYGRRKYVSLREPEELRAECRRAPRAWVVLEESRLRDLEDDEGLAVEVAMRLPYLQVSLPALRGKRPLERMLVLAEVVARE